MREATVVPNDPRVELKYLEADLRRDRTALAAKDDPKVRDELEAAISWSESRRNEILLELRGETPVA